jgi:hypothetical protein
MEILRDQSQHETLLAKASTPLYEGSSTSILATILLLLNLRTLHGVSSVSMDELFSLLRKKLLPKGNKMPTNVYEALNLIKALGLSYDSIHACPNGCVLFRNTSKGFSSVS